MLLIFLLLLLQGARVPGVLDGPDPKQMESAPPLGYHAIENGLTMPDGVISRIGSVTSVTLSRFSVRAHTPLSRSRRLAPGGYVGITCGRRSGRSWNCCSMQSYCSRFHRAWRKPIKARPTPKFLQRTFARLRRHVPQTSRS